MKNVVVIGGGHGQSTILKGIKRIPGINISAIVTVADDGGSTGRLRERYNIPAMGDARNIMVALADEDSMFSDLMNYRFAGKDEQDVVGHNLGNLIITALAEMSGSFAKAITEASDILKIKGTVIPSSLETITLFARMDDDTIVKGEANIPSFNHEITEVFYDHDVQANEEAIEAIENADLIIYGIGSVYTSICSNIIISGIRDALNRSKAKKVYFANCMTQSNETFNYDLKDHVDALKKHGAKIDVIVAHNDRIPGKIIDRYLAQDSIEVINNHDCEEKVIEREVLDFSRGLVRHDPEKIRKIVEEILEGI